jgi:hypothetical protein
MMVITVILLHNISLVNLSAATYATTTLLTLFSMYRTLVYMRLFLNASEVAKLISVDRATVARWIKKGVIKDAIKLSGSQNWQIPLSSYQTLVASRTKPYENRHV